MAKATKRSSDSSSSTAAKGNKKKRQTAGNWGPSENQKFADLVDKGKIILSEPVTNAIIDPLAAKYFSGRSLRSVRERIKDLVTQYRLEEDLAGGRIPVGKSYDLVDSCSAAFSYDI